MAALVETMFCTREKAWHGLGTVLPESPTAEDAIVAAGLDWEVKSNPLHIYSPEGQVIEVPNYVANTRMTDNRVLGVVSTKYQIVQNKEAFQFVDALLDEGLTYESAGSLENGKSIFLLGKLPQDKILGDIVEPYICFNNRHDGQGSIRVCATPVRVVCNNTLNLALRTAKRSWATRHIGDMQSKLDEARHTLGMMSDYMDALKAESEYLADTKMTDAEVEAMLDTVYPIKPEDSDIRKKRVNDIKESIFVCMMAPDIAKFRNTAYGTMMAVTDYADHAAPIRKTEKFEENRWSQIMIGHPFVDAMYKQILANRVR